MILGVVALTLTNLALIALVAYLVRDRRLEREAAARQTADLLQRIQAPAAAVAEHSMRDVPPSPVPIPLDDDEAFHTSREELARALNVAPFV